MRTTASGQSILLLFDAVAVLDAERIDYAVIGALAASVHGAVRGTTDADAVLSISVKGLRELAGKFKKAGFTTELREGDFNDPIPAMLVLADAYANQVDLLAGLRGMDTAMFSRAIEVPFDNETLKVMGPEDFIATKVFAGGPQDIEDARLAIEIAGESLDVELLRRLARGFGAEAAQSLELLLPLD